MIECKKMYTALLVLMLAIGLVLLVGCKEKQSDGDDDSDDEAAADDSTEDADTEDNDVQVSVDGENVADDEKNEDEEADRPPLMNKDDASPRIAQLDDPLDEIEETLEDMSDDVIDGTATFSEIKFNQVSTALNRDLKLLNGEIGTLTDMVYSDQPDFAAITEKYYEVLDKIGTFYQDASQQLEQVQGTTSSSSATSSDETSGETGEAAEMQTVPVSGDCVDTDGVDFYVQGTASGIYYTGTSTPAVFEDKCTGLNDEQAYDYYCERNRVRFQRLTCANGCVDGTCVR